MATPPVLPAFAPMSASTSASVPIATPSATFTVAPVPSFTGSPAMAMEAPARPMPPTAICVRIALEMAVFARLLLLRPVANSETATHDPVDSFQTDLYDLFMLCTFTKIRKSPCGRQDMDQHF